MAAAPEGEIDSHASEKNYNMAQEKTPAPCGLVIIRHLFFPTRHDSAAEQSCSISKIKGERI
jgi:hypothetical protein